MIPKICKICEKEFKVGNYRKNSAKYCSQHCYKFDQRGTKNIDHHCKFCGKHFLDSPSRNRIYCSKACVNKSEKEFFQPKYITVRKMMVRRGLIKKCELCGYNTFPDILGVHHKDENRKNNSLENLMIVCPMCHSLIHHKHISH